MVLHHVVQLRKIFFNVVKFYAAAVGIHEEFPVTIANGQLRAVMERLAGAPIPGLVNSGLCGLRSESLDWDELEAWCGELIAREGPHYYLEQSLVAMLAARMPERAIAPAADYVTLPSPAEIRSPSAVMHHYVAESKRGYFREGWRHVPR